MPAATCETVRLPVHTPPARVAVVGAMVTGGPIDSRMLGIYELVYGEGEDVPDHVNGSP